MNVVASKYEFEYVLFDGGTAFFENCADAAMSLARKKPELEVYYIKGIEHAYLVPQGASNSTLVSGPPEYGVTHKTDGSTQLTRLKHAFYPQMPAGQARAGMKLTP